MSCDKKENVNTNLIFNRLVGTDNGHTLKNLNIDENTRGESLSIENFGKLSEELCKLK